MYYVYVLQSLKDNSLYYGYTSNLRKRFQLHQVGRVASTKKLRPWRLVYYEAFIAKSSATSRESSLKNYGNARAHLKKRIAGCLNEKESAG